MSGHSILIQNASQEIKKQINQGRKIDIPKAMQQAGYSKNTIKYQKKRFLQSEVFREKMEEVINLSINNATKKATEATFRDSVNAVSVLSKTLLEAQQSQRMEEFFKDDERNEVILERIQRITMTGRGIPSAEEDK